MRIKYSFILLSISFLCFAQQKKEGFSFLGNDFDGQWQSGATRISGGFSANSNSFNVGMFNDFLFRTSLSEKSETTFLENSSSNANLYSLAIGEVEYKLNSKWGLLGEMQQVSAYSSSKDMFELFAFGNSSFQNTEVRTNDLMFLRFRKASLNATYSIAKSKSLIAKGIVGVSGISNYQKVSSSEFSVFTATGGEYLDISASDLNISEIKEGSIDGIGLQAGLELNYVLNNKNEVGLTIRDVNLTYLLNTTAVFLDTAFTFTGLGFDFVRDTNSLEEYVDSNYLSVVRNAREQVRWTTLPSRVSLRWLRKLSCRTDLLVSAEAIDLGRLGVTGSVGVSHDFSDKFRLFSSVGYGNFTGFRWVEAAEYNFGKMSIYGRVQSLHSLIAPYSSTNYGSTIGISVQL